MNYSGLYTRLTRAARRDAHAMTRRIRRTAGDAAADVVEDSESVPPV